MISDYPQLSGFQSSVNTTTTPTTSFTGTAEQNDAPDVMVSCYSDDQAGTLYFDFSVDGTNWRTFPTDGFTVTAGIHEFHTAVKGPRYFRARWTSGSSPTTLQLYTYFGTFRQPSAPIGFNIADDADAIVTKSVISGVGDTTAKVTDHKALQVTPPPEGKTAFGEVAVAESTPAIQVKFPYGQVNDQQIESRANQSGTVTVASSMLTCQSGAAANSSGTALTRDFVNYRAGEGVVARFTGLFTTGVANSTQTIGIGDSGEGFFFGYNGTAFGILHRYGGAPEVRTLTVSTASTTAEDITITLDGDADATVTVTNSGNTTTTANEIASNDYSDIGEGWNAVAVGSTVVFTSWSPGAKSGTYSLSSATTAVGTFAQTLAGTSATDTWVAQASWNGADKFDGNGLTGVTLDPTKGNVYQIKFQYLGFGAIYFYIEDPDDGEMHLVHTIEYANANTTPSVENPSLPIYIESKNTSNTSNLTVKTGSMAAFIEGKVGLAGPRAGAEGSLGSITTTLLPVLSIRVTEVFNSTIVRSKVKVLLASCSVEHTKAMKIKFYSNPTLTGASWTQVNSQSLVYYDTTASAISGGTFLFAVDLGRTGDAIIDISQLEQDGVLTPGNVLTAAAVAQSGTGADANAAFYFAELI